MEQTLGMRSTSGAQSDQFLRNVFLLKNGDFEIISGQVHMPTKSEIATIRARTEQYQKHIQFHASMSSDDVKKKLEETFPYLKNKGFVTAAKRILDNDTARFDFDGSPCRWNGRTIKRKIQGNSSLYILESDQMDMYTSSGISASDSESLQDVTEMSSLLPWLRSNLHFDVECNPNYSPLQGGGPCVFTFRPELHPEVTSVYATFGELGTQKLRFSMPFVLGFFPASPRPAVVIVTLKTQDGITLGEAQVTYGANLQQVVSSPSFLRKFCEDYNSGNSSGNFSENSGGETESSRTVGCNQPVQMLSLLVYVAAEIGALQFLKIIFTSSAGMVVFSAYKENSTLPEVIARDHGNEETANYLEDVTKRFSEEITTGKECSHTIDWSELVKAAEAAEKQLDVTSEKEDAKIEKDILKETGYLGDIDTSSSESAEAQSSDSDDDISRRSKKESQMKAEECKQQVWQHEDHPTEDNKAGQTQRPISFLKDGEFPRGKVNVKLFYETKPLKWKESGLQLTQASHFQEARNLRQLKSLHRSGISFLLDLRNEPVQHHLITAYQRVSYLLTTTREKNAAEAHQSLEHSSTIAGNKADHKSSSMDCLQQIYYVAVNEEPEIQHDCYPELTPTDNSADPTVRMKLAELVMEEHCQSAASDFWVLTYVFRPTRKILFVYVADNKDVFPFASCDDRQYELSWLWQRCKNNVPKLQEICKRSELKNSQLDPPPLEPQVTHVDTSGISGSDPEPTQDSKRGKRVEIAPQGDLHRKDRNKGTEDAIAGNYRDRKETSHQFDSSLERLDSSLHDRVSIDLPINDPTGETLSTPYRKKESGSFKEDLKQPGHCGSLPDSTYLVGRDDTCEQIITLLTSNKAVEIVAPPGYGKTSVVVEVAHRMIKRGKFVAYVKPRRVTCVEDLGSQIIEALGAVAEEDPIKESMRCLRAFQPKSVVLIIENIDNLLHVEYQVSNEEQDQESGVYCSKMRGKYKKDDFLTFLTEVGQCPAIHLILTSRETVDFSVRFASEPIELEPLSDDDSATLFTKRDKSLDNKLVREFVRVCGGIPLVICTVLAILKKENPQNLTRMLSTSTPFLLLKELSPDTIANEDRINKCLEVCFNRLSEEKQDVLVKISTFPHGFTEEHFVDVFKPLPGLDLQTCMNRLKHSSLVRFDRRSYHYSFNPFLRDYFSQMPQHTAAKSVFIRHYSDLTTTLCKQFLSRNSKSAIEHYRKEKENIREAMTWCGDDHPELEQTTREHCIRCFNKSAVFLAKVMRKQEFESLFCKLSYRCRYDKHLYSACLTNMGMKIVLSCTCSPHICPIALHRAKFLLSLANEIQSSLAPFDYATRAQCLSKLAFCFVREGHFDNGYDLLDQALTLTKEQMKHSVKKKDKVMLAACNNDLAACQMMQRKHLAAIETRRLFVLPDYEDILGDHPFVATTLSWIANSYLALGDYDNAIKFTRRALEIREQQLGHHQETARSFYDLGVALSAKKEYESALESLKKAVSLQEEVLDTHDELIHTHQAMSVVLTSLGREEEAEREMKLAAECAKRLDSLEVPEIVQTIEHMERLAMSDPVPIRSSHERVNAGRDCSRKT